MEEGSQQNMSASGQNIAVEADERSIEFNREIYRRLADRELHELSKVDEETGQLSAVTALAQRAFRLSEEDDPMPETPVSKYGPMTHLPFAERAVAQWHYRFTGELLTVDDEMPDVYQYCALEFLNELASTRNVSDAYERMLVNEAIQLGEDPDAYVKPEQNDSSADADLNLVLTHLLDVAKEFKVADLTVFLDTLSSESSVLKDFMGPFSVSEREQVFSHVWRYLELYNSKVM